MNKPHSFSRRKFIGRTLAASSGIAIGTSSLVGMPAIISRRGNAGSLINGVQVGVITYSFRSMKDQSAEATLDYVTRCGIDAIELMGGPAESFAGMPENNTDRDTFYKLSRKKKNGDELSNQEQKELAELSAEMDAYNRQVIEWRSSVSMKKFAEVKKMYAAAGVKIYAFKPSTFRKTNTDAEIDYGIRAAKALGASHITLEHPSDDQQTQKLGTMAAKHEIYVGYHGHLQQTSTLWDTAIQQSKYNAMNLDAGHYVAAGNPSVIDLINAKYDKIMSMHMKDRQTLANGQANLPWGQGDTPIAEILQTMQKNKYHFPATVELEYKIPAGSDAVQEVTKCVGYCKNALNS